MEKCNVFIELLYQKVQCASLLPTSPLVGYAQNYPIPN